MPREDTPGPAGPPSEGRVVLSDADIARALKRIAHEILEANKGSSDLVLIGIPSRGVVLAERLADIIEEVEGTRVPAGALDITMYRDDLRRNPTRKPMPTAIPGGTVEGRIVVLVDDVLYSGRTVRAALDALADYGRPKAVRLAVLVDRGHRELPIRADHVGKNLPTAHSEKVRVRLRGHDDHESVSIAGEAS